MKKLLLLCLGLLLFVNPCFSANEQWTVSLPLGTHTANLIDDYVEDNNIAHQRLNILHREGLTIVANDGDSVNAMIGTIAVSNAALTTTIWRRITTTTEINFTSNLDTGSEANSTQYYIYAVADATATTCTFMISASSTTPTGATYYRKIGYFYNNSSGDIINVGNLDPNPVVNSVYVTGTDDISIATTWTLMDDMTVYFVSNGRPLLVVFEGSITLVQNGVDIRCDIGGTDKPPAYTFHSEIGAGYAGVHDVTYTWYEAAPTAGPLTITIDWNGTGSQNAATDDTDRRLIVFEL